jgi:hypothetical protein
LLAAATAAVKQSVRCCSHSGHHLLPDQLLGPAVGDWKAADYTALSSCCCCCCCCWAAGPTRARGSSTKHLLLLLNKPKLLLLLLLLLLLSPALCLLQCVSEHLLQVRISE